LDLGFDFFLRFGQNGRMAKIKEESSKPGLFERLAPILLVVSIGLAFMVGVLWQKVSNLEKGGVATTAAGAKPAQPNPTISLDTVKDLFSKDLVKFGDANRKVLFVEVADPSCPFCHAAAGKDPELSAAMGDTFKLVSQGGKYVSPVVEMKKLVDAGKASYVYIYSPGHNNGEMGMKAILCANEQGKFWEVHDIMMSEAGYQIMNGIDAAQQPTKGPIVKNDKTKSGDLATFLKSAIDPNFLKTCLDSGKYDARLASDTALATQLGTSGTPFFAVNATTFPGAYNYTDMKSVVDAALK